MHLDICNTICFIVINKSDGKLSDIYDYLEHITQYGIKNI